MGLMDMLQRGQSWAANNKEGLSALGVGLGQLANGQAPNLQPQYQAMMQRQRMEQQRQALQESGVLERFTPEQRAILAQMEPGAAQSIIAQTLFAKPERVAPIEVNGQLIDPTTGQVIGDYRTPETQEPLIINGQVVDRQTGEVVGDYRTPDAAPSTSATIEYDRARAGGYTGTFEQWQLAMEQAGASQNNVNIGPDGLDYGKPGEGLVWQRDPATNAIILDERGAPVAIPFQGGSVYRTAEEQAAEAAAAEAAAAEQAAGKNELAERAGNVVIEDIGRLMDIVEEAPWYSPATGMGSGLLEGVRGSNAADAAALATTIKANIGFDRLQQMRDSSPSGGALGNVTELELATLQSVLGSIELSQSEDQLLENLQRLDEIYSGIMEKFAAYPNAAEFGLGDTTTVAPKRLVWNPETGAFD